MTEKARLFDKRVVDRNIDKGLITQQDVDVYLSTLPDMAAEAEELVVDSEENDEEDEPTQKEESESGFNFEADDSQGPKNVYDF